MAVSELVADPRGLSTWAHGANRNGVARSRHDYDSKDHIIDDMMHEGYWRSVQDDIEQGDLIWIIDAKQEQCLIRIDWIDKGLRKSGFSLVERISEHAVAVSAGYAIKWRGPKGGFWCVIDGEGVVVRDGHRTRQDAERARDILNSTSEAA